MDEQLILRRPTDTASPQAGVPIFLIHSITNPFCRLPGCWCKTFGQEVTALFAAIGKRELIMQYAAPVGASYPQVKEHTPEAQP